MALPTDGRRGFGKWSAVAKRAFLSARIAIFSLCIVIWTCEVGWSWDCDFLWLSGRNVFDCHWQLSLSFLTMLFPSGARWEDREGAVVPGRFGGGVGIEARHVPCHALSQELILTDTVDVCIYRCIFWAHSGSFWLMDFCFGQWVTSYLFGLWLGLWLVSMTVHRGPVTMWAPRNLMYYRRMTGTGPAEGWVQLLARKVLGVRQISAKTCANCRLLQCKQIPDSDGTFFLPALLVVISHFHMQLDAVWWIQFEILWS